MKTLKWWLKRLAVLFVGSAIVLAVLVYGTRAYLKSVGSGELASVSNRLDAEEPGWKLESIESKRRESAPRPEQNSTPHILKVAELISEQNKTWSAWRTSDDWTSRVLSPHLPREKFQLGLQTHKKSTVSVRQLARGMKQLERGYYPLVIGENPYATLLPHVQKAREVATLLEYDGLLAAVEHDSDQGIASAHAILNTGRSIGDEPFLISQLVRIACTKISTQTTMQVLAWGEPKLGLAELQLAYRAEADVPFLLVGLRGERAALHRMFEGLESGQLSFADLEVHGLQKSNPAQDAAFHLYRGLLPGDHAKALEILTGYMAAARMPHDQQLAALAAIPIPPGPPNEFRYIVTRLLIPACAKVAEAALRARADLLCTSTAIACERFRQMNGRWPNRLGEISKDILREIPSDPYSGQPLCYHRFEDGIAVYSVGDGDPATIRRQLERKDPLGALGVGVRLWNPGARRQPPLPEPIDPEEPK